MNVARTAQAALHITFHSRSPSQVRRPNNETKIREDFPMFRKILIAVVASLSLLSPFALPAPSEAHEVQVHEHHYHVYYRNCHRDPWCLYGCYDCRHDAVHAAHHLWAHGHEVYVR